MKRYELYSGLSPEELKKRLTWEVSVENEQYKKRFKIILRWTGKYEFTFRTEEYSRASGVDAGGAAGPGWLSAGFWAGTSWSAAYSPVFCGQIAPDGAGSVISGHFRQVALGWAVGIIMVAAIAAAGAVWGQTGWALLAAVLCIPMAYSLLRPDRTRAAGELWDVLEQILAFIEDERKQEIEKE